MRWIRALVSLAALSGCACDRTPTAVAPGRVAAGDVEEGTPGELFGPKDARVLALGDSYTIGESVAASERYPNQVVNELRKRGVQGLPAPAMLARTGWTVEELLSAMDGVRFSQKYDCVLVLIGVNNEFRGGTVEAFQPGLNELLDRSTKLAGGRAAHVIVVSIPDWGMTPMNKQMGRAGVSAEIDAFNRACEEAAVKRGMPFVNITDLSRNVPRDERLTAPDGLHPSGVQYEQWAERIAPVAEKLLR